LVKYTRKSFVDIPIARQSAGAGDLVEGNDMDELISKRAVIEAIEKARANVGHNLERSIGKSIIEILDDVGMDVDRLPSAQPGIIRCKDCLYQKMCLWKMQGADFCSYAERREDG
jgi:hypothetical protein